jgi:hypothetical protein
VSCAALLSTTRAVEAAQHRALQRVLATAHHSRAHPAAIVHAGRRRREWAHVTWQTRCYANRCSRHALMLPAASSAQHAAQTCRRDAGQIKSLR